MNKQQKQGTVRVTMSFGDLAQGAREVLSEAVKSFSRQIGQEGRRQESGARIERAKAEAVRRSRQGGAKAAEGVGKGDASFSSERLRQWRREFFGHARRFGWASELLQSEDWRKAGRALAEERLRDSAIHLAQAGLRVGSQGLGSVIGGILGAETGPGAAVAAWAGSTFLGAVGDRAASALDVHLSRASRRPLAGAKGRGR
ncbi:MAG: hypothetical protein PHO89_00695 [Methylacidiphilaceae bacterium]|nr:hypothetical protein [Candidatus Methylacidiphilaceae bacterium]